MKYWVQDLIMAKLNNRHGFYSTKNLSTENSNNLKEQIINQDVMMPLVTLCHGMLQIHAALTAHLDYTFHIIWRKLSFFHEGNFDFSS